MRALAAHEPGPGTAGADGFRHTMAAFATGVTVVTSAGDAPMCGTTVNSFTSVSLDPPLVLICLATASATARAIERNRAFAVNVLAADQEWLARRFAVPGRLRGTAAFRRIPHREAATGAPVLDRVAGWLDCRLAGCHVAGDHRILIGEVLDLGRDPRRAPLVFHGGRYRGLSALSLIQPPERR